MRIPRENPDHRARPIPELRGALWARVALFLLPCLACGADESTLRFSRDEVLVWAGEASVTQTIDGESRPPSRFEARAIAHVAPDGRELRVLRALWPQEEGDASAALVETHRRDGERWREVAEEVAAELDGALRLLDVYVPRLPVSWPTAVTGNERELRVLGTIRVPSKARETRTGTSLEVRLPEGESVPFEFQGHEARLVEWTQRIERDLDPARVRARTLRYAFELEVDGTKIRLSIETSLTLERTWTEADDEPSRAARSARELLARIDAACASRHPSAEIATLVEQLGSDVDASPWRALGLAARSRLEGYRALFESDEAGAALARLLDGAAPDFTLQTLDGKSLSLREASRGKVTLLSFWGYG